MHDKTSYISLFEKLKAFFVHTPKNRQQLINLLRRSQQKELIDANSLRMIEGVMQVSQMRVSEIMIPRSEMVIIERSASYAEIAPIVIRSSHSRFPVIGENKDEVIGILLAKDLLSFSTSEEINNFAIKNILRPAVFIPESKRLDVLLNEFRKSRNHLAIIVDEYGGVSGLVSIEDVLEQIVGDIVDEHDRPEDVYIRKHKDNNYSIKAITPIETFNDFFNTNLDTKEFDTIGGLVLKGFGHLPKRGEKIIIADIPFTVLNASSRRINILQTSFEPISNDSTKNT